MPKGEEELKEETPKEEIPEEEEILVEIEKPSTSKETETKEETSEEETEEHPEETSEEVPQMFQGKTPVELVKIIRDKEKFIGEQSKEIGDLRTKVTPEKPQTSKEVKESITNLKGKLNTIGERLAKLDPDLDEEYSTLSIRKKELTNELENTQQSYQNVYMREIVRKETAGDANIQLNKDMRKHYEDEYKLAFTDEEWNTFRETINNVSLDVKHTKNDYESALIHTLGIEKYRKIMIGQAEANARGKIAKAKEKETPTIEGGKSSFAGTLDLLSLSKKQLNELVAKNPKVLDKLTPEQLGKLYKKNK